MGDEVWGGMEWGVKAAKTCEGLTRSEEPVLVQEQCGGRGVGGMEWGVEAGHHVRG